MAEIIDTSMPERMQSAISTALQKIEREPWPFEKSFIDIKSDHASRLLGPITLEPFFAGLGWFNQETGFPPDAFGEVEIFSTTYFPNTEPHIDEGLKTTCSVASQENLNAGTVVFTNLNLARTAGLYVGDLLIQSPNGLARHQNSPRELDLSFIQPQNGQLFRFDAGSEIHSVPPMPAFSSRFLLATMR